MRDKLHEMNLKTSGHMYTVSSLTGEIKTLLEEQFPFVWVTGEISNHALPASGHCYFTLKDTSAVISAVMFKHQRRNLKFDLHNGMKVFGLARISLYEPRGTYQLIFEHLEPDGTGSLQLAFEQLKAKLSANGIFDTCHKQPIPVLSRRVCVITSPTGAAVKDIVHVATRRFPNCWIQILSVKVQGSDSEKQICQALEFANQSLHPDLILLARGGGSLEDLAAFNSESVADALFHSKIPVITGIGHETDFTIADFVADLRAPTPSAAAEMAFPDKAALQVTINQFNRQLHTRISRMVQYGKADVVQMLQRLKTPVRLVDDYRFRLEDLQIRMKNGIFRSLKDARAQVDNRVEQLDKCPLPSQVRQFRQQTRTLEERLHHHFQRRIHTFQAILNELNTKLDALNPQEVLKRGYSISLTLPEKQVIKNAAEIKADDMIQIVLSSGHLTARVEKTNGPKKNI